MILCPKTDSKGTGFLLPNGWLLTNEHVVRGCGAADIVAKTSSGQEVRFTDVRLDATVDLAAIKPTQGLSGGLALDQGKPPDVGTAVTTWGFPLGYNGPAPLLSVGYLAGFIDRLGGQTTAPHLVVNGAFNPGNSGGPLFRANSNQVIGVVVSKHAPISQFHLSAIKALAENQSGIVFTGTDATGKQIQFVESQIVAGLLDYFRSLTQVMIGEAIAAQTVSAFLKGQGL
jgi:S1-C subfamily serine protease